MGARFKHIDTLVKAVNRTEYADRRAFDMRLYISSAPLDIGRFTRLLGRREHALAARHRVQGRSLRIGSLAILTDTPGNGSGLAPLPRQISAANYCAIL